MSQTRLLAVCVVLVAGVLAGCTQEISRKETWGAGTGGYESHFRGGNPLSSGKDVEFERQAAGEDDKQGGWFDGWFE